MKNQVFKCKYNHTFCNAKRMCAKCQADSEKKQSAGKDKQDAK